MIPFADILMAFIFLSIILCLASNRLMALVKIIAFQGIIVSIIPLALEGGHGIEFASLSFLVMMLFIKGFVMPFALYLAVKRVSLLREIEPYIGYHASILFALLIIMASSFISFRLSPYLPQMDGMLLPAGLTMITSGFFLMISRHKAITQVIAYLMLENGIYLLGIALASETHTQYILEFGVLLDVLAGVMIMGIVLYQISRSFDDIDTRVLGSLTD
jgi:hydrogenase-4 component E